jgi:CRISPR-associated protein Cmr4
MYKKAYGIIETLAPLHVGATAGEESGNLNLIFRDQFTQTGIIPGSSIRGRLRSEMRQMENGDAEAKYWYGDEAGSEQSDSDKESVVKFEYASLLWLPVFCPGQPIAWVTCPRLLRRYQRVAGDVVQVNGKWLKDIDIPEPYTGSKNLKGRESQQQKTLFFNLGFLTINKTADLSAWFPSQKEQPSVIVDDGDIGMIHDMALYRQSRVRLKSDQKIVEGGGFFNTEALPEGTILVFPIAIRKDKLNKTWNPFTDSQSTDIYLGGLESIGLGHCQVTLHGV